MRILVVEDQKRVAKFIAKGFREESYGVDVVHDGEEAVFMARSVGYDAIVLDLMLPQKDGMTALREMRGRGVRAPVIILTAKGDVQDRIDGLNAGADDYLPKPFAFGELLARVRALMRRGGPQEDPTLELDDLVLDPARRQVRRAGKAVDLTAKEFAVLEYLLRNKNRVVTRTSIIEHVWDIHFDTGTNIVDVYVRRLRSKIDDDFDRKLIHTIRGVGYTMKDAP